MEMMRSPLFFQKVHVRFAGVQMRRCVSVPHAAAVSASNSFWSAAQTSVNRSDTAVQRTTTMCMQSMPQIRTGTDRIEKSCLCQYFRAALTEKSCYSTVPAKQNRRTDCGTPHTAGPGGTGDDFERRLFSSQPSVDRNETTFFDDHSADWWDLNGPFSALHDYTPYRVEFVVSNLQILPHYQQVLRRRLHIETSNTSFSDTQGPLRSSSDGLNISFLKQEAHSIPRGQQSKKQDTNDPRSLRRRPNDVEEGGNPQKLQGRLDGFTILDVGCGGGIFSEALAREGAFVIGVDASQEAVKTAEHRRLHGPYAPLIGDRQKYVHGSLENLVAHQDQLLKSSPYGLRNHQIASHSRSLPRNCLFDVVLFSEVLEHIKGGLDGVETLLAMATDKCLKAGGLLMVSTLNRTFENYLMSIVAAERVFNVVPQGTHSWDKFVKPEEISLIGERHGLRLIQQRGFMYIPYLRIFVNEPFCRFLCMMAFEKL